MNDDSICMEKFWDVFRCEVLEDMESANSRQNIASCFYFYNQPKSLICCDRKRSILKWCKNDDSICMEKFWDVFRCEVLEDMESANSRQNIASCFYFYNQPKSLICCDRKRSILKWCKNDDSICMEKFWDVFRCEVLEDMESANSRQNIASCFYFYNQPKSLQCCDRKRSTLKQFKKWSKGKVRDKLNNLVLFDKATYEKMLKEIPSYKLITPSVVSDRLKVRGSLARKALEELQQKAS